MTGARRRIKRSADTKLEVLNRQTTEVTTCAWPGCPKDSIPRMVHPRTRVVIAMRVGILCFDHADAVADAVLEQRVLEADFLHHEVNHAAFDAAAAAEHRAQREQRRRDGDTAFRGNLPGFVYYLQVGEHIKVGYSVDVRQRMRAYPPGSVLLAVEPGSPDLERQRHREFAGSLLDGREWFRRDAPLQEHIDQIVMVHGDPRRFRHSFRSHRGRMRGVNRG